MNKGDSDGLALLEHILPLEINVQPLIICPPAIILREIQACLQSTESPIFLGAQHCAAFAEGAYTGDIIAAMIKGAGAAYVLIGHSERRLYHHKTLLLIHEKLKMALSEGLRPILCVRENKKDREAVMTCVVLKKDLENCIGSLKIQTMPMSICGLLERSRCLRGQKSLQCITLYGKKWGK